MIKEAPAGFQAFREPLMERPGCLWIAETFRRYREPVAQATSTTASTSTGTSNGS